MSITLAIDTASHEYIAVAIATGDGAEEAVQVEAPHDHTHRLLPLIQSLVGGHIADLERVAVVRGPGSFAGLRVGIAVARGLALATGAAVTGVGTLDAVAEAAGGTGIAVHPVGRHEYAVQEFADGTATGDARVASPDAIPRGAHVAGEGASAFGGEEIAPRARCLAALHLARRNPGAASDAIYLRDPRITPPRRNLSGTAPRRP